MILAEQQAELAELARFMTIQLTCMSRVSQLCKEERSKR